MHKKQTDPGLSRREQQIMDILYARGRASGAEIQAGIPDQPGYSGVRTILRILERKGHVTHVEEGLKYVYRPVVSRDKAKKSAIEKLVSTFFGGSVKAAAAAFLDPLTAKLSEADLAELDNLVKAARRASAGKGRSAKGGGMP